MQDDSMEGIGRVEYGTETEQLPRACRTMNISSTHHPSTSLP